ncbi:MAG: polysaccharide deacetylase family protein [Deltaproteobacteria bacterium]|nr:polysaccharide deacetylase family protein [Deltaproteobacteria bacterium]
MKLCAVSVDLDEVPCYHAIHGLPMPADDSAHAVYTRAVPRLGELFTDLGIPATFFVIGRDLEAPIARSAVLGLDRAGHELGNHTHSHRYDLVRLGADAMRAEVRDASDALAAVVGPPPGGLPRAGVHHHRRALRRARRGGLRLRQLGLPLPRLLWRQDQRDRAHQGAGPVEPLHRRLARGAARARRPVPPLAPVLAPGLARVLHRRAPHRGHPRRPPPLHRHHALAARSVVVPIAGAADGGAPAGQPGAARPRPARRRRRARGAGAAPARPARPGLPQGRLPARGGRRAP